MPGELNDSETQRQHKEKGKQVSQGTDHTGLRNREFDGQQYRRRRGGMSDSLHQHRRETKSIRTKHRAVNAFFYTGGIFGYRFSGNRAHVDHVVPQHPMISKMISDKTARERRSAIVNFSSRSRGRR